MYTILLSFHLTKAESTVIEEILSSQSVDVTPVSGATFSSNGIIEAVSNALNLIRKSQYDQCAKRT